MQNTDKNISYLNVLSMKPKELAIWLEENYACDIPTIIETLDDLKNAGILLGKLTNIYSFIMSMATFAKLSVRDSKRAGLTKDEINDCIDRRDILDNYAATVKMQYTAISRMITVKKQIDEEMKMM